MKQIKTFQRYAVSLESGNVRLYLNIRKRDILIPCQISYLDPERIWASYRSIIYMFFEELK